MPLIEFVLVLLVIGVLLRVLNVYGGPYIAAPMLKIINAVVILCVVLWVLAVFGVFSAVNLTVPRLR